MVGGDYVGTGDIVMTVIDPSLGFATGGGWYTMPGGTDRVNFGFEVKATVNKNKTVYKGSLLVIRHMGTDIIKVKSNVFDLYAITTADGCGIVTFSGKATYSTNGVSSDSYAYNAYAADCGTPGTGLDKFGLYLALAGNNVATSTTVAGLRASAVPLSGGNIQVPHPQGGK